MWGKSFSGETRIFAEICVVTHDWGSLPSRPKTPEQIACADETFVSLRSTLAGSRRTSSLTYLKGITQNHQSKNDAQGRPKPVRRHFQIIPGAEIEPKLVMQTARQPGNIEDRSNNAKASDNENSNGCVNQLRCFAILARGCLFFCPAILDVFFNLAHF